MADTNRYHLLDALRGLSIVLMVLYHFGYDLVGNGYLPKWALYNPLLDFLQPLFAGIFILLCGASSRFTRSNVKRGLKIGAVAIAVSAATYFFDTPIYFGILHFLAVSIFIYAAAQRLFEKIPAAASFFIYAGLFAASYPFFPTRTMLPDVPHLWMFGILQPGFRSPDYFPLIPWFFCFLLGTWFGDLVKRRKLPGWFYNFNMPILPAIGRHTLEVYALHQIVLMGVIWLFQVCQVPRVFL